MKHTSVIQKLAGYAHSGILAIVCLMLLAPLAAYAGQGETFTTGSLLELIALGGLAFGFVTTKDVSLGGKIAKIGQLSLDKGFYASASGKKGAIVEMEEMYAKESGEASPYLGLSHAGIHLHKKELRKKGLEVPLTAFEKQLLLADIRVKGEYADPIEKFFATSTNAVLFPAFVSDQILVGQLMQAPVNDFIHTRTTINAKSYDKITMSESEEQRQTKQKTEGGSMREFTIVVGNRSIKVKTYAGLLKASYEAVRYQRVPVFAKMIQRIGLQMAIDKMDELVLTLKNGDGNTGTAITSGRTYTQAAGGAIALVDIINWAEFAESPYVLDKFVGLRAHIIEWKTALAGMNNPKDQFDFIGVNLPRAYRHNRSTSGLDASTNAFYGVDSRFAVEEVNNGPVLVEADRLIDKQLERTAISESTGFALDENAVYRFTAQ